MATVAIDTTAKLLKAIKGGKLDSDLDAIREAVNQRMETRRASLTIENYPIGTKVRLNNTASGAYAGRLAVVVGHR